jgi:membrane-bound serine protease (ClpP class)
MTTKMIMHLLAFVLMVFPFKDQVQASTLHIKEMSLLSVNSAITPATYDYLKQNFETLPDSSLIVVKLNTPGGLVNTTKDIITMVGRMKRPFIIWITPEGASASSAGAIIASAAHFIFMSPGTNIGAATPVGLGQDISESDGRRKALNDLTALVRSLSNSRNRPAAPFEKMINSADSFTTEEALRLKIIDGVISEQKEMISFLNSKKINIEGVSTTLILSDPVFKDYGPSLGQRILEVIANPSTAYILFLIGIALIYFEFQAPGGFISGSVGLCFLILSGISFQVLPLDWGSMGLIIAGIFLLILEIYVVSYGILAIAGLISFTMGSLFLFHGESGFISVESSVIFSSLAGVTISLGLIVWYLYQDKKKLKKTDDFFLPVGAKGEVLTKIGPHEYQVKVRGEIWHAFSEQEFHINEIVYVSSVDPKNLTIRIQENESKI